MAVEGPSHAPTENGHLDQPAAEGANGTRKSKADKKKEKRQKQKQNRQQRRCIHGVTAFNRSSEHSILAFHASFMVAGSSSSSHKNQIKLQQLKLPRYGLGCTVPTDSGVASPALNCIYVAFRRCASGWECVL